MFKPSVATRVISFAVLITFLLASFPTAAAGAAKTNNQGLERKWARLVDVYKRQSLIHNGVPRWVGQWMSDHRRAPASEKAEIRKNVARSNTAWGPVPYIVMRHNGFDANGKVIDKAAARQSVKDLSQALQHYAASMKSLKALIKQFKLEE
jgi:hypothetical protein